MRTLRLLLLVFAGALLVAACGGDGPAEPDTADAAADTEDAADAGDAADAEDAEAGDAPAETVADGSHDAAATRSFSHFAGVTEVPVAAQRIVTLQDQNALLPLLELGVVPIASVAIDLGDGTHRFRRVDSFDTSGIDFVGDYREPDLELIAAQEPDLIVGVEWHEDIYPQLSEIAPTVLIQIFERPLPEVLADFADLVDATERHEELAAGYEQAVADLVADLPRPPEEIVLSEIEWGPDGGIWVPTGQARGTVLEDVGFARPEAQLAAMDADDYTSFERVPEHEADVLISADFTADSGDGGEAAEIAWVRQQPLFLGLDVVQRGEFHVFDGGETVGSAFEKMENFVAFLRSILVEREANLTDG